MELSKTNCFRQLFGKLYDGVKKINADVSEVKESVKNMESQIAKQNERMGSLEELFDQQDKNMKENEKIWKKLVDKGDNSITKTQKSIDEIKNAVNKVKKCIETNQDKMMENIKKNSTSQANNNKKWNEEAKKQNEQIVRTIESKVKNIHNTLETCKNDIKNYYDVKIHGGIEDLKAFISSSDSSLRESVSSRKINSKSLDMYNSAIVQQNDLNTFMPAKSNYSSKSTKLNVGNSGFYRTSVAPEPTNGSHAFARSQYSSLPLNVTSVPYLTSTCRFNNRNSSCYENHPLNFVRRSAHTPLAEVITYNETSQANEHLSNESPRIVNEDDISANLSPEIFKKPSSYIPREQYSRKSTRLNIKRKTATPNTDANNLIKRNLRSTSKCSSTFFASVKRNETAFTNKDDNTVPLKNIRMGKMYANMARAESETQSSPYLTLYEAATMAEEFTFN
ncbi:hypothetical protein NPIL_243881 [Nephila pilipes]|uniref:Uncharacterized protein n=1 Tax=Nephila pilipes TaxID=299642 RepID=A0A8X6PYN0_NEPPI|nr:hypothetical protein NPIL_243881 [Nephila pilipes]